MNIENELKKVGIIDVGGGFRDIFGAGVFDYLLDNHIEINNLIGISAGANNILSYVAKQRMRNLIYYLDYGFRNQYMSLRNILRKGTYVDYDYIYNDLGGESGEFPLDYDILNNSEANFTIVTTNGETGNPGYFDKNTISKTDTRTLRASGTLPFVSRSQIINNEHHFDGGIANPIPIDYAFDELGWKKIILILTREKDFFRDPKKDKRMVRLLKRRYPQLSETLSHRAGTYNSELLKALELEREGKCLILAPTDIMHLKTLTRNKKKLTKLYLEGFNQAKKIIPFVEGDLK